MTKNQPTDYCAAIGYTDGRVRCPIRPEGHPDRVICESTLRGGQWWWCDGERIEPLDGNPAQALCKGHVKTCDEAERWCAEADW